MRINLEIPIVKRAHECAVMAHKFQKRKYTGEPYFYAHCVPVAEAVLNSPACFPGMVAAALCHDVLEDTNVGEARLAELTSPMVMGYVKQLTKPRMSRDLTRRQRLAKAVDALKFADPAMQTVKYADILCNVRGLVDHDPAFAAVYLPEKRLTLQALARGCDRIKETAMAALIEEERKLARRDQQAVYDEAVASNEREMAAAAVAHESLPGWGMF